MTETLLIFLLLLKSLDLLKNLLEILTSLTTKSIEILTYNQRQEIFKFLSKPFYSP